MTKSRTLLPNPKYVIGSFPDIDKTWAFWAASSGAVNPMLMRVDSDGDGSQEGDTYQPSVFSDN